MSERTARIAVRVFTEIIGIGCFLMLADFFKIETTYETGIAYAIFGFIGLSGIWLLADKEESDG